MDHLWHLHKQCAVYETSKIIIFSSMYLRRAPMFLKKKFILTVRTSLSLIIALEDCSTIINLIFVLVAYPNLQKQEN